MRVLKILSGLFLLLVPVFLLGLRLWGDRVEEWGREKLEERLEAALRADVDLGAVRMGLFPPRMEAESFRLRTEQATVRIERAMTQFCLLTSVVEGRAVFDLAIAGARLEIHSEQGPARMTGEKKRSAFHAPIPFRLRRVELTRWSVALPYRREVMTVEAQKAEGTLESRRLQVGVSGEVLLSEVAIKRAGLEFHVDRIGGRGELAGGHLLLSRFFLHGRDVSIAGGGERYEGEVRHHAKGRVTLQSLAFLDHHMTNLAGHVHFDVSTRGALTKPRFEGEVRWSQAALKGFELGDLSAHVAGVGKELASISLQGRGPAGAAEGHGSMSLSAPLPFRVEVRSSTAGIACLLPSTRKNGLSRLSIEGALRVEGTLFPLSVRVDGKGKTVGGVAGSAAEWELAGHYEQRDAGLRARLAQGSANAASLQLDIRGHSVLAGEVAARVADTGLVAALLGDERIAAARGAVELTGAIAGTIHQPELRAVLRGKDVTLAGTTLQEIDGALAFADGELRLEPIRAVVAGGGLETRGKIALAVGKANDVHVTVREVGIDPLVAAARRFFHVRLPLRGGSVSGVLAAQGPWAQALVHAEAHLKEFHLLGELCKTLDATLVGTLPHWEAVGELVHRAGETLRVAASGHGAAEIKASAASTEWRLPRLRRAADSELGGRVAIEASVEGRPTALGGRVEVRATDLAWRRGRLGSFTLTASGEKGNWSLHGSMLDDFVRVEGRLQQGAGNRYDASVLWHDAPLSPLLGLDPDISVVSSGSLALRGRLDRISETSADLRVAALSISEGPAGLYAAEPIRVRLQERRWMIDSLRLVGEGSHFDVAGRGGVEGDAQLSVSGAVPLSVLELLFEPVHSARGRLTFAADIDRTTSGRFSLQGMAALDDGAFDFGLPIVATNVAGRLNLDGTSVRIEHLSGHAGGGSFAVGGSLDPWAGPDLTWELAGVSTTAAEGAEVELSGRGKFTGSWHQGKLAGELRIEEFLYDQKIALTDFMPWFKRALAPRSTRRGSPRRIALDLHVTAPEGLYIDNNVAKVEMRTDLLVRGDTQDIELSGRIEVIEGEVVFNRRKFTLNKGTMEFHPDMGLNPVIDFSAESVVTTQEATRVVMVDVTGTGEQPRVMLSADEPGLSQTDLAALVTLGRTRGDLQSTGGSISTEGIVGVGAGLYSELAEEAVRGFLPIDRIELEPAFSAATGALEPRVAVGKDLTRELSASLTTTLGAEARRSVEMEYRLTRRVSLIGTWESETRQEAGAFGGRVKLVYPFRRLPRWSLVTGMWGGAREGEQ